MNFVRFHVTLFRLAYQGKDPGRHLGSAERQRFADPDSGVLLIRRAFCRSGRHLVDPAGVLLIWSNISAADPAFRPQLYWHFGLASSRKREFKYPRCLAPLRVDLSVDMTVSRRRYASSASAPESRIWCRSAPLRRFAPPLRSAGTRFGAPPLQRRWRIVAGIQHIDRKINPARRQTPRILVVSLPTSKSRRET